MNCDIFNMTGANNIPVSLPKALLVFYVLIASQFTGGLLGKQMRTYIEENRLVQHVIGFVMMVVVINIIAGIQETDKLLFYSTLAYFWFIISTKLDIQWNLILILSLFTWFLYENRNANKQYILESDVNLDQMTKNDVANAHKKWNMWVTFTLVTLTFIGTYCYSSRKCVQYGGGKFNIVNFLFY